MPINRLTAFSVLAAALLVVVPVQAATTSKAHSKTTHAKQAQPKSVQAKSAHHKPVHGSSKLAKATHKNAHPHSAASSTSTADADLPTTADTVAAVEMKPELPISGSVQSESFVLAGSAVVADTTPSWLNHAPVSESAQMLVQSVEPTYFDAQNVAVSSAAEQADTDNQTADAADAGNITDLRKALITMAMKLRDIRYVRGGHDPSTGFDCSGFVRYVFAHAIGMQLPTNSASQFLAGLKVNRADMKAGDLVFFHTHGKRGISHVGIYISDGQFIHSPATGESVQISSLNDAYWAKHFAGAKRPEAIAMVDHNG